MGTHLSDFSNWMLTLSDAVSFLFCTYNSTSGVLLPLLSFTEGSYFPALVDKFR
jgi:hypothetical protein